MSRELRFVLILGGSIFGIAAIAGIAAIFFLGSTVAKMEHSSSPQSRKRIAERIAPIPEGYRVESASEILSMLNASLKSPDGAMEIMLQTNTLAGSGSVSINADDFGQKFARKTMQLAISRTCSKPAVSTTQRILVKDRTIVLNDFVCPEGGIRLKVELGQFAGRLGLTTMTAVGTPAGWDAKAVREVLGAAP
jgi:hypothetical protein